MANKKHEVEIYATHILLSCIDHRCTNDVVRVMPGIIRHSLATDSTWSDDALAEMYDHITIPGASLGVVQSTFPAWGEAFWQQLELTLAMREKVRTVILLDHMDCGAYKRLLALDAPSPDRPGSIEREREEHLRFTATLRDELLRRFSKSLRVERWLLEPTDEHWNDRHHWHARDLDHQRVKVGDCVHETCDAHE